jgi:hypothetical protein
VIRLRINRHERTSRSLPGGYVEYGLGALVESYDLTGAQDTLPRVGELVTVHPNIEPDEDSWTGEVTGVQHVFGRGSLPILTVRESA